MKSWKPGIIALAVALLLSGWALPAEAQTKKPRILYLTLSKGFKHKVLPESERIMQELAAKTGAFEVTVTQDAALINAKDLKNYDIIMFYTTGELPFSDEQKADFLNFIKAGKGFIGVHSATDTFYQWAEYGELIGGYFDGHPWNQDSTVGVKVEDANHPTTRHFEPKFQITDEIYQFKNWSRDKIHVVLSLDTEATDMTKKGIKRTDGDFALAWGRDYGKGRVFYTALGHRPEVWNDEQYQKHLIGAVQWVTRQKEGKRQTAKGKRQKGESRHKE